MSPPDLGSGQWGTPCVIYGGEGKQQGWGSSGDPPGHSQHEVLLPGGQVAPHCYGCALDILHLQGHVGVKLLCGNKQRVK